MLVDTNLLVYAALADAHEHSKTRAWLDDRLADVDRGVVLCWPVAYAFVRLATSARALGVHSLGLRDAWEAIDRLVRHPHVRVVVAGPLHPSIASELVKTPGLRSDDVPDIELAALAIEHGLVLASHDSGFRRFAALRTFDPLMPSA